jgi:hypothetical protein
MKELPPDTVILMRESDHMFREQDARSHEDFLKQQYGGHKTTGKKIRPSKNPGLLKAEQHAAKNPERDEVVREEYVLPVGDGQEVHLFTEQLGRPGWSCFEEGEISPELLDLHDTLTYAADLGIEGFVWLAYNTNFHWNESKQKRPASTPYAGAFCAAVTTQACRTLIERKVHEWEDMHTGTFYKRILTFLQDDPAIGVGYIYPPLGHYFSHVSSTWSLDATKGEVLPTHWNRATSVVSGTSASGTRDGGRYVMKFREGKAGIPLHEEPFDPRKGGYEGYWKTQAPPGAPMVSLYEQPLHKGQKEA